MLTSISSRAYLHCPSPLHILARMLEVVSAFSYCRFLWTLKLSQSKELASGLEGFMPKCEKRATRISVRTACCSRCPEPSICFWTERSQFIQRRILYPHKRDPQWSLEREDRVAREAVRHKNSITDANRASLDAYFDAILDLNDPRKLTLYDWYQVTVHFCLRGSEV